MQTAASFSLSLVKRTSRALLSRRSGVGIPVGFQSISNVRFFHWIGEHIISPPSPTLIGQLSQFKTDRLMRQLELEPPICPEKNKEKFEEWARQSGEDEMIVKKFDEWMLEHRRVYRDAREHRQRYLVFKQNYLIIEDLNRDKEFKTAALMPFSDILIDERLGRD